MVRLATPLVVSMGSVTIMYFIDRVFLLWYSDEALAASLPAGMASWSLLCFPLGLASYVTTFVAQYFGARHYDRTGLAMWQGVFLGLLTTPCFLATAPLAEYVFPWAGHAPNVTAGEVDYYRGLTFGAGGAVTAAALASFFTGLGRTQVVMVVNALAATVNLVLDYFWIFGHGGFPRWGITGAAAATSVSQWLQVILYALWLVRCTDTKTFGIRQGCRLDMPLVGRMLRFSIPHAVQQFAEMTAFLVFVLILGQLGKQALAATNMALSINAIAFLPLLGLGAGVMTLVGHQIGRNRPDLAARATWTSFTLGLGYTLLMGILYVAVPGWFMKAHALGTTAEDFAALQRVCAILLRFVAVYLLWDMTHIVFVHAIKGAGDTRFVLIVTLVVAPIPVVLGWLGLHYLRWNLMHFWSVITAWVCVLGVAYFYRFQRGAWRHMRVIEETAEELAAA